MKKQVRKFILVTSTCLAIAAASNTAVADTITDARQETQIWTTYALSPYLRAHDLKVVVHDGKATLTGSVGEDINRNLAKQIALGVKGIKDVENQIVVQPDYIPPQRSSERSFGEVIDDATITAAVKSKLLWSKYTDGMSVDVDTRLGRVTLKGKADSDAASELAHNFAMNTHGVVSVKNELMVVKPAVVVETTADKPVKVDNTTVAVEPSMAKTAERAISDTWITTKVKSTFMYSSNVNSSDIKVSTDNGIVSLSGTVNSGVERALAIELTQNVRGVHSVNSKGLLL